MPKLGETLAMLERSKVFYKMYADSSFWQIKLEEDSREPAIDITPFERFRFRGMHLGISAALEFFQRQMMKILERLAGMGCKMDDVLVYGKDEKQHDRLKLVMGRLEKSGMAHE